jgi:hypothetical protein
MLAVMIANALYINNVTNSLLGMLEELPSPQEEACLAAVLEVQKKWESHAGVIRLSAGYSAWDRVAEQLELTLTCLRGGDLFGYRSALALLRDALEDLRRHEKLTPDGWI